MKPGILLRQKKHVLKTSEGLQNIMLLGGATRKDKEKKTKSEIQELAT